MIQHNFPSHSNKKTPFAKKVLQKINDKHIVSRPRWVFSLRNRILWIMAFVAVLIASVATSAILFALVHADWQYALVTHTTWQSFLIDSLPFMWMAIFILFSGMGYVYIRITSYGYRYTFILPIIGIIIGVCVFGVIFFISGFGQVVEEGTHIYLPWYKSALYKKQSWWSSPAEGFLFGTIITKSTTSFSLMDSFGKKWTVDYSQVPMNEDTDIQIGKIVGLVGIPYNKSLLQYGTFYTCFVIKWDEAIYKKNVTDMVITSPASQNPKISSVGERISQLARISKCRSIRSYKLLRTLDTP